MKDNRYASGQLSKREIFAMNAPDCPEWFSDNFIAKNEGNESIVSKLKIETSSSVKLATTLTFLGRSELIREWGYHYADIMLK